MILTKYLFTSCRNAALLMNTGGVAPGWLFGRGDFGWNRGKTLEEIMGVSLIVCVNCMVSVLRLDDIAIGEVHVGISWD